MARVEIARLPTSVESTVGIAALTAIVSGAAMRRRRRRAARRDESTVWATSGSTVEKADGRD